MLPADTAQLGLINMGCVEGVLRHALQLAGLYISLPVVSCSNDDAFFAKITCY